MKTRRKAACLVAHSHLSMDPRVRREAAALVSDGWAVDIICLRGPDEARREDWCGTRVYRLPVRRRRGGGFARYLFEYLVFFLLALLVLSWLAPRRRYVLVQAHNVPDFLVFTALVPRLFRARIVLDIRDPLPDLYLSKFGGDRRHPLVRMTSWLEARSAAFADHVLTPGEPSRQRLIGRGIPCAKVTNILNSADPALFRPLPHRQRRGASDGRFTLIYHGGLFDRYGLDVAIRAVDRLRGELPGLRFLIGGYGEEADRLEQLVRDLGLEAHVQFAGWIAPERIMDFAAAGDLGVVPYRQDSFTDLIYPTKAFEYMAMNLPVIMSGLEGIVELFPDTPDLFVRPNDVGDLADRIRELILDPARLHRLNAAAGQAYACYCWEGQRQTYLSRIQALIDDRPS